MPSAMQGEGRVGGVAPMYVPQPNPLARGEWKLSTGPHDARQEGREGSMQRYILRRFLHSLLAIWVMSMIVFSLARVTGNPLDVLLPLEAGPEEYERVAKHWGLDKPLYTQYLDLHGQSPARRLRHLLEVAGAHGHGPGAGPLAGHTPTGRIGPAHQHRHLRAHRGDGRGHERHPLRFAVEAHRPARPVIALLLARDRADVDLRRAARVVSDLRPRRPQVHGLTRHRPGLVSGRRAHASDALLDAGSAGQRIRQVDPHQRAGRSGKSSGSTACAMPRSCR